MSNEKRKWIKQETTKDCTKCKYYLEKTCIPNGFDCTYEPKLFYKNNTYLSDRDISKINTTFNMMKRRIEILEQRYHITTEGEKK